MYDRDVRSTLALVALAACHAGAATPAPPSNHAAPSTRAPSSRATGTSGWPGIDWGIDRAALLRAFPDLTINGDLLTRHGPHEGRPAVITFGLDAPGGTLEAITVVFDDLFPSMDACAGAWATERASLDRRLGASQSENLAAYWTTSTTAITLMCDSLDSGVSGMAIRYQQLPTD